MPMTDWRINEVNTGVLVIGGGATAALAALEAAKMGLSVCLADKGRLGRSGSSPTSGGGIAAVLEPGEDTLAMHLEETIAGGEGLNDPALAQALVEEGPRVLRELVDAGLALIRNPDGSLLKYQVLGHSRPRTYYALGSGTRMMEMLRKEVLHRRVQVLEGVMMARLLTDSGRVAGAIGLSLDGPEIYIIHASAVILAAGSATGLYKYASANFRTTGDAYALACEQGCRLANMELAEFTVIPKVGDATIASAGISPFVGLGNHFVNRDGERFLKRYDPERLEHTTRATLVQAIYSEMRAGRGPVTNDPSPVPAAAWDIREQQEGKDQLIGKLKMIGVNCRREPVEWVPAVHTFLGGLLINADTSSPDLPGLFAAGEAAAGIHGANRLSANALTACFVLGQRAGRAAATFALANPASVAPDAAGPELERLRNLVQSGGAGRAAIRQATAALQAVAWQHLSVARNAAGLKEALAWLADHPPLPTAGERADLAPLLEQRNLHRTATLVAECALRRNESRGQHFREDFPARDDANWRRWLIVRADGDRLAFSERKL